MKGILLSIVLCLGVMSARAQVEVKAKSERQLESIERLIPLSDTQKGKIKHIYRNYQAAKDSLPSSSGSLEDEYQRRYDASKEYHENLMKTLTDAQISKYVRTAFAPEVKAKTEYRISLLRQGGNYTEEELASIYPDIYNYLMLEKIVYYRYKYDYAAQKNNISRLKALQPTALKESQNIEKMNGLEKVRNGRGSWK